MNHPLLLEIQLFAVGKNTYHRDELPETTQMLVSKSLRLLEELPVLRDSIFDYYSNIFDVSIEKYVKMEKSNQSSTQNDNAIIMIKEGLEKLLMERSWAASFISQWSLSRLIKPSVEYAMKLNLDFKAACTLWLGCNAMRCLLDLCGLCFSKFDDNETKRYIYDLENVFADNRPNFDWCVAHLSSLFPLKFVSNILRMPSMFTSTFIQSTVTVLEYLSSTNERSLNMLLREIIEEALNGDQSDLKSKDYIPNLIQLSSRSEIYAQSILNVFLEFMQKDSEIFVDKLKRQALMRPLDYKPVELHKVLPDLILRTSKNGTKLLLMLADRFCYNNWCMELLELVLVKLQSLVFNDETCPLFNDIRRDHSWDILWNACSSDKKILQQTAVRLILLSSSERNPILYYKTIEKLIRTNTQVEMNSFNALIRLLDDPIGINDIPDVKIPISHIIQRLVIDVENRSNFNQSYFILKNFINLVTIEKSNQSQFLKRGIVTSSIQSSFRMLINIWEILLRKVMPDVETALITNNDSNENIAKRIKLENDEDDPMEIADLEEEKVYDTKDHIHMITNLIDILNNVGTLNMSDAIRCEKFTIKYFFWCLTETDEVTRVTVTNRCYNLLSKQCSGRKGIRSAALRDLLEGALFLYPNLFGAPIHVAGKSQIYHKKDESLLKLNQKQGISLNVSRSSILHSGVIGCGIPKVSQPWIPDGLENDVKNIFLKAIVACCINEDNSTITNNNKSLEGFCLLSHILVELVTTDVMYNGIAWPEEEFTRVTIERDLHIRRTFKNCPILWSIMGVLAMYKQPLYNCSVFLRAICASVMHHWRAKSTETINGNNSELMFFTVKLLELLSLGQLLPPPLNYLYIVVQHLEPNEIAYVLKECVWNYMVANGPAIVNPEGFEVNQPLPKGPPSEQFVDPLRNTMQKKLSTLGNLYYQMFILSPTSD
ncbi:CLUMA_CG002016, isoform A [Clunio marinus]|uniref:CLUMA_CG002016, isoform A n=1 Tax=Clunio marinus TaxID=568069 RepID=A0A1J1HJZ1_9DIPT|nr:CLUMA_CG002016, isoform A [Clunio marinus]